MKSDSGPAAGLDENLGPQLEAGQVERLVRAAIHDLPRPVYRQRAALGMKIFSSAGSAPLGQGIIFEQGDPIVRENGNRRADDSQEDGRERDLQHSFTLSRLRQNRGFKKAALALAE